MAIAISGLNASSFFGFDRTQSNDSRQQAQQTRSDVNQDNNRARGAEAEARSRVIPGEVVGRETESQRVDEARRTLEQRQTVLSQPDSRQISQRAAVEIYQQNETLVSPRGEPRQVSGIIDEFV